MSTKKTLLVCAAILAAAAAILAIVLTTEPEAQRSGATRETAMLVDVVEVERGTFRPTIVAMGTVRPAREVVLSPRVGGRVVQRSEGFTPGGLVRRGEVLVRIDPADYENALTQRRSELEQAEADLALELGRQEVARKDYQLLEETIQPGNRELVLRQPQLKTARARVESARAAVEQAGLALERTAVRAPFDAQVLTRQADVGSQVAPGEPLGRLVGTDHFWVEVAVPVSKLALVPLPGASGGDPGTVEIHGRPAWPGESHRAGRIEQVLGELAGETRMARVLVTVPDPLAREAGPPDRPRLMIGAYVEARIEGEELAGVVRLDRDYLRPDDTVWVMAGGELEIRRADVTFRDSRHAYLASGLADGDRVVTTNLSTVAEGAPLRLRGEGDSEGGAEPAAERTGG